MQDAKRSIIDENAYRYGGMTSKAFRKRIREQRVGVASGASESSGEGGRVVAEDPK